MLGAIVQYRDAISFYRSSYVINDLSDFLFNRAHLIGAAAALHLAEKTCKGLCMWLLAAGNC